MRYAPQGQIRLTVDEIAIACTVLTAPGHELLARPEARAAIAGLRAAGALDGDGTLGEPGAGIVRVIARAELRLEARVWHGLEERVEHRAWFDGRDGVVGDLAADGLELTRIDPRRLPLALALRLGLGDDLDAAVATPRHALTAAPAALMAARALSDAGDRRAARAELVASGVDERVADAILTLAEGMRVAWSATSSWREPRGEWQTRALSALAAGSSGWWTFVPATTARLEPTDAEWLWRALHRLLPGAVAQDENIEQMSDDSLPGR
jgi:hypothetical protein